MKMTWCWEEVLSTGQSVDVFPRLKSWDSVSSKDASWPYSFFPRVDGHNFSSMFRLKVSRRMIVNRMHLKKGCIFFVRAVIIKKTKTLSGRRGINCKKAGKLSDCRW